MSHFTVLVSLSADADLKAALQPFHEYECTGIRDEHVVFVDEDEAVRKEFAELGPETRWRDERTGETYCKYDRRFYRPMRPDEIARCKAAGETLLGTGYSRTLDASTTHEHVGDDYVPHVHDIETLSMGLTKFEADRDEQYPGGIEEFARDYHGYEKYNGRIGHWTNPNAKWDWWVAGGRWSGQLLLKSGGEGVDVARVGDIDLNAMKVRNVAKRRERVEGYIADVMEEQGLTRDELRERWDAFTTAMVDARADYKITGAKQSYADFLSAYPNEAIQRERAVNSRYSVSRMSGYFGLNLPNGTTFDKLEEYIQSVPALSTFAVLHKGEWYERGSMGWWGIVSDEKSTEEWDRQFDALLRDMDPDTIIAVVDCHI